MQKPQWFTLRMQRSHLWTLLFFVCLLIVGLRSFADYGISWDEKTMYVNGREAYERVFEGQALSNHQDRRYHGVILEFGLYMIERALPLTSAYQVFAMRHLAGFLFFYLGVIFFFALAYLHFKDWKYALLGAAMLTIHPRIFAHAFFNTRDIPNMTLFIVAIFTLLILLRYRTILTAILHAIPSALLMSVRMTGLLLPALTLLFLFLPALLNKEYRCRRYLVRTIVLFFLFLVLWVGLLILFWPLLWEHPIQHFLDAYAYMSSRWGGGFYFGEKIAAPWHFVPVWIAITTPLVYTILFFIGTGKAVVLASRHFLQYVHVHQNQLLFILWFFVPVGMIVFGFGSVYDTWRHLFFVYPAFVLIALEGVRFFSGMQWSRRIVVPVLVLSMCATTARAYMAHPLEYVYFSIPSSWAEGNFELDYWGIGYRKALETIVDHSEEELIPVFVMGSPGTLALNALSPAYRRRIQLVSNTLDAQYVIDDFRGNDYGRHFPDAYTVSSLYAYGMEVMATYSNPDWNGDVLNTLPQPPEDVIIFFFPAGVMDPERADKATFQGNLMTVYFEVGSQRTD